MDAKGAPTAGGDFRLLWWTRRRSVALDAGLAVVSAVECAVQGVGFADRTGLPVGLVVVPGALAGLALLVRRRWPLAVILISIAVLPANMGAVLALVGLYTLATTDAPRRVIAALACMEGLGTVIVTYLLLDNDPAIREQAVPVWFRPLVALLFGVASVVPPVLLGMYVRARRRLVETLRDRALGLERELGLLAERAEERAEWARDEERRRIAREMHDVVAHRVSLMVVHAAAVQAVAPKDPEKAARNASLIGDMGRQALTELRTMLGVLRAAPAGPTGASDASRASRLAEIASGAGQGEAAEARTPDEGRQPPGPAGNGEGPRLTGLRALVEESRAAGMRVELAVEGEHRDYPEQVESTAYRVVQEALTNVHKHAAGAAAWVRLAHRDGEVAVQVRNEAPDGAARRPDEARLPSGGNGLVGMRERVTALGGGFVSGPTDEGGFRVSAVIPDRPGERAGG
ncbi:sensor histidine kinase [Streptomyces sp. 3MP-14]|uniref:histidine kinase n=1 Tax=Streptomyces mimosae TaxID=2586635 RepID=A0A5N5ZUH5_9ACTN|nr:MULTISPECIES: histidine kinase [Streptomyces]KAB8160177.1 sensor histidine kinase [Streptomyces mimosae]KAB8176654.1 sensor histidine kinase [Streptomyces sp. 3MP-14]